MLGAVSQPFAELSEHDTQVPLSNCGGEKLLRCGRCGAYVNPRFRFAGGGAQVVCNLCGVATPVPLQEIGIGEQADRHELSKGTYEFMAPQILHGKEIKGNNYVLIIDCGKNAVSSGKFNN